MDTDASTMSVSHKTYPRRCVCARIYEFAMDTPIGVICMYSAQKVRIDEIFSRRPWEVRFRNIVRIETVDSYQGKENTIVVVSLVRCNGRGDQGHVRIPNRCNVALS